jgi:hypothetical protein
MNLNDPSHESIEDDAAKDDLTPTVSYQVTSLDFHVSLLS